MIARRLSAIFVLVVAGLIGWWVASTQAVDSKHKLNYGLDLSGGSRLTFVADTSTLDGGDVASAMTSLRDVIERRVNQSGTAEATVAVERSSFGEAANRDRLVVELPGITDPAAAAAEIGKTPLLEFRLVEEATDASGTPMFSDPILTGAHLKRAALTFDQTGLGRPMISFELNDEGGKKFGEITEANVGRQFAIFLDGAMLSAPVIREEIPGGKAVISGDFTVKEAQEMVRNLNYGALPVNVTLLETRTVGASLGADTLRQGETALLYAIIAVAIYMLVLYRLPGLVASLALVSYSFLVLAIFKIFGVTLTAAGIAGLILSVGVAVDANVLIFERLREELGRGRTLTEATALGFSRAWPSIRDGNLSSLISAVLLFWLSGVALVKGFALVFAIGVISSMATAILVTWVLLRALGDLSPKMAHIFYAAPRQKQNDAEPVAGN